MFLFVFGEVFENEESPLSVSVTCTICHLMLAISLILFMFNIVFFFVVITNQNSNGNYWALISRQFETQAHSGSQMKGREGKKKEKCLHSPARFLMPFSLLWNSVFLI